LENKMSKNGFGTAPVFLAAISTILGAILFLRFGYAVGHAGLLGAIAIVLIGHAVTIPTALAVSEIATNLRVEGGGEYFIISRSFGATVGGTIGISLYFSQAISVAFYLIAFAEAFRPLFPWFESTFGIMMDPRFISLPAAIILVTAIFLRGANLGVGMLWGIFVILFITLVAFFVGGPTEKAPESVGLMAQVTNHDNFMRVFAIIFPAFTGMTMGVGLSGDLANPRKSIPLGTMIATFVGLIVYILMAVKMAFAASPSELANNQFVMAEIAVWGPIVPIGLGAATISSAIGSILVAPRTLQAMGLDHILPMAKWNKAVSKGHGESKEPRIATLATAVIVLGFVALGDVDFVAQIISMFFMITYGSLNAISFLEHFGGNPSYRPTFRTRWYFSLFGAVAAVVIMFLMNMPAAILAMVVMTLIYIMLKKSHAEERSLSIVVQGVMLQFSRMIRVWIQKMRPVADFSGWRPSFIAISPNSFNRLAPFEMLRWFSHHYGFGTYLHYIEGPLNTTTNEAAKKVLDQLIEQTEISDAGIYVDTIISPSFKTAVAQMVQIPGIAGMDNNSILFEFEKDDPLDCMTDLIDGCRFAVVSSFNILILRSSARNFGYKRSIHVWINPGDYRNANLMILLAYMLLGHPEWRHAEITVFDSYTLEEKDQRKVNLLQLIDEGRIPISRKNVISVEREENQTFDDLVCRESSSADLVITGLSIKKLYQDKGKFVQGFKKINDILFVRAGQDILITSGIAEDFKEMEIESDEETIQEEVVDIKQDENDQKE